MMILISEGDEGLAYYLRHGIKKGEPLTRLERDIPVPLMGSLEAFEAIENWMKGNVKYKGGNYRHITISFSENDMEKISTLSKEEQIKFMQNIIKQVLSFYLPGYTEEEIQAYAEAHYPLTKMNPDGTTKKLHIHLAVPMYSPALGKKMNFRPFNVYEDDRFQEYLNKKYNLDNPKDFLNPATKEEPERVKRRDFSLLLKNVKTEEDIFMECLKAGVKQEDIKLVETKRNGEINNRYYKVKFMGRTYNLRGKNFEACEAITNPNKKPYVKNVDETFEELEAWVKAKKESWAKINKERKMKNVERDPALKAGKWRDKADRDLKKQEAKQRKERKEYRQFKQDEALAKQRNLTKQEKGFIWGNIDLIPFDKLKDFALKRGRWNADVLTEITPDGKVKITYLDGSKTFNVSMSTFLTSAKYCGFTQTELIDEVIPKTCGYTYEAPKIDPKDRSFVAYTDEEGKVKKQMTQEGKIYFAKMNSVTPMALLEYCKNQELMRPDVKYDVDPNTGKIRATMPNGKVTLISTYDFLTKTNHCGLDADKRNKVIEEVYKKEFNKTANLDFPIKFSQKAADLFTNTMSNVIPDLSGGYFWNEAGMGVVNEILAYMKKTIYSATKYRPMSPAEVQQKRQERMAEMKEKAMQKLRDKEGDPLTLAEKAWDIAEKQLPNYLKPGSRGEQILTQMGYRDGNHAEEFGNLLIYDIDNTIKDQAKAGEAMSMDKAYQKLKESGLSGFVISTKSYGTTKVETIKEDDLNKLPENLKPKFKKYSDFIKDNPTLEIEGKTDKEKLFYAANDAERYRLVVFGKDSFKIDDPDIEEKDKKSFIKETYKRLRTNVAEFLGIDKHVDLATNDIARIYKPSGENAIAKTNITQNSLDLAEMAKNAAEEVKKELEAKPLIKEQQQLEEKINKINYSPNGKDLKTDKNYLTEINFDKIYAEITPEDVFKTYGLNPTQRNDKGHDVWEYQGNLYSIVNGNDKKLSFDYKTGETIDVIEMMKRFTTKDNLRDMIQEFSQKHKGSTAGSLIQKNLRPFKEAIENNLINDFGSKQNIKEQIASAFRIKESRITIDRDSIKIFAGKGNYYKYSFNELGLSQKEITKIQNLPQEMTPAIMDQIVEAKELKAKEAAEKAKNEPAGDLEKQFMSEDFDRINKKVKNFILELEQTQEAYSTSELQDLDRFEKIREKDEINKAITALKTEVEQLQYRDKGPNVLNQKTPVTKEEVKAVTALIRSLEKDYKEKYEPRIEEFKKQRQSAFRHQKPKTIDYTEVIAAQKKIYGKMLGTEKEVKQEQLKQKEQEKKIKTEQIQHQKEAPKPKVTYIDSLSM